MKIVSVGAAVQDVFLSQSDDFVPVEENHHDSFLQLELGAKVNVNKVDFRTGGGATNAAVTFARQGFEAEFIGTVGDDPAAHAVMSDLDAEGVLTERVRTSKRYNTGYSVILLANTGERTIMTYRGASTHYSLADFDFKNLGADWLYVSAMAGKMDIIAELFDHAREQGVKIMFNPGKQELKQLGKLRGLLEDVSVLLLNREEMQTLVSGEELEELARHGTNLVPLAIVSDGPNGVVACDGKTLVRAGMYEDVPVLDRTGAGDAFGSGFLSQWAQGKSLKDSIIFASANSTSVVTKIGAKPGILRAGAKLHSMPISEKTL